jgi:hypothetical protein
MVQGHVNSQAQGLTRYSSSALTGPRDLGPLVNFSAVKGSGRHSGRGVVRFVWLQHRSSTNTLQATRQHVVAR